MARNKKCCKKFEEKGKSACSDCPIVPVPKKDKASKKDKKKKEKKTKKKKKRQEEKEINFLKVVIFKIKKLLLFFVWLQPLSFLFGF